MRAAIYTRVSTDEQATEGYSLGDQERQALARIEREGWEHVGTFSDPGVSGADRERPGLSALLDALDRIDVVVLAALDRLGRDMFHVGELFETFQAAEVRVESLRETLKDDGSASSFLGRGMLALFGDYERRVIKERTKAGVNARVRKGHFHGSFVPMGYKRGDDGLVPDAKAAKVTKRIFREYIAGRPLLGISQDLDREGVPTVRGGRWSPTTVRDMLKNPVFIGKVSINGEVYDGLHKPIIDKRTWDRAQALLNATKGTSGLRARPRGKYLLIGGLLRCGECGEAMTPSTQRNPKSQDRETYRCLGKSKFGSATCSQPPVTRALVDRAVWGHFSRVGLSVEETKAVIEKAAAHGLAEVTEQRERAEQEAAQAKAALDRVKADYTSGAISAADWKELRADLEPAAKAADAALAQVREREEEAKAAGDLGDAETETLKYLAELRAALAGEVSEGTSIEAVRAALLRVFEKFTIHRAGTFDLEKLWDDDPFTGATDTADGEYLILAEPRAEAVLGLGDEEQPVLRREPLGEARSKARLRLVQLKPVRSAISSYE
jgi:site-specific DNA recombinase